MDVRVVGAAEAAPQQAPPVAAPQAGENSTDSAAEPSPQGTSTAPLTSVVAKLFAHDGAIKSNDVNVSYRVEHDPNMIVTVITDSQTGEEIAQFPPEVMVQLAQFFDKESGITLDRSA